MLYTLVYYEVYFLFNKIVLIILIRNLNNSCFSIEKLQFPIENIDTFKFPEVSI